MADEVSREQFQCFKKASSILDDFSLFLQVNPGMTSIPGFITPEEMAAVIGSFDRRPSEDELREMIGEIDANRYGILEFVEFFNRMTSKVKEAEDTEEELKEAFKVFDKDQNGFISPNELRQVMINLGEKLTDEEVEQMIKEADLDGDGLVNYDDFFHLMTNLI